MVFTAGIVTKNGTYVSSLTVTDEDVVLLENATFKKYGDLSVGQKAITSNGANEVVKFGSPE